MVTEKNIQFHIIITVDVEAITDSPYWPAIAQGKSAEQAEEQLLAAEVQKALEDLPYVHKVEVVEEFQ